MRGNVGGGIGAGMGGGMGGDVGGGIGAGMGAGGCSTMTGVFISNVTPLLRGNNTRTRA